MSEKSLVIRRKQGEAFTVDGPARIVIDQIGKNVQIRILAEETTKVMRDELLQSNYARTQRQLASRTGGAVGTRT